MSEQNPDPVKQPPVDDDTNPPTVPPTDDQPDRDAEPAQR